MATRRFPTRSKRQKVEWSGSIQNDLVAVGADATVIQTSSINLLAAMSEMTSPTIVRIRGEFYALVTGGSASDDVLVGAGICVVSTKAAGVGQTAVPSPLTDLSFPWMWHHMSIMRQTPTPIQVAPTLQNIRIPIDCKAMRKVLSDEEELVNVVETSNAAGTATIVFAFQNRVLIKQS